MYAAAADPTVIPSLRPDRTARLRDGRVVAIRPVRPSDAERLREFDCGLSEASRSFRYLGWMPPMSPDEAVAMATVDFQDSFAFVAVGGPELGEAIVAECRIAAEGPDTADIAVVVADDYQDLGLGPILIRLLLATAAGRSLGTVTAEVRADNSHMIHVLTGLGFRRTAADLGVFRYTRVA